MYYDKRTTIQDWLFDIMNRKIVFTVSGREFQVGKVITHRPTGIKAFVQVYRKEVKRTKGYVTYREHFQACLRDDWNEIEGTFASTPEDCLIKLHAWMQLKAAEGYRVPGYVPEASAQVGA